MKNLKSILMISVLSVLFVFTACDEHGICEKADGPIVTEVFELEEFEKFDLCISANVELIQGDEQKVIVEGPLDAVNEIKRNVSNGEWRIDFEECMRGNALNDLKIFITLPEIEAVKITGSGDVKAETAIEADQLDLEITGSGNIDMEVVANEIDAKVSGSGDYELWGTTDDIYFKVSGSGKLKGFDLEAKTAAVRISGSGDARLTALEELDVNISGSGDIYYRGYPAMSIDISGSGDIYDAN